MLAKWSHKKKWSPPNSGRFVIQKHQATHLHYDFRLEISGVLVSWAISSGPSTNPDVQTLAIRVQDHAIEYLKFEGMIPEGHYGAGPVMVWDIGTFYNVKKNKNKLIPLQECLDEGEIIFFLQGIKLNGLYTLRRISPIKKWLLIKLEDQYANIPKHPLIKSRSALTKRTLSQIKTS